MESEFKQEENDPPLFIRSRGAFSVRVIKIIIEKL
jgi:hypothetical protein